MYRDYAPQGVKFYYIYKALAHPEKDGYIQPYSLEERLMHVKEAQRTLGSEITWLCDSISNDLKHALGDAPNSEFVIGPDGKVLASRNWSRPDELRKDLEKFVGPVKNPTRVSDLAMKRQPPPKVAASGVVPRLKLPSGLQAVKIAPQAAKQPFYVKLRAEADDKLLRDGAGALYLGFHVDPIYRVHWNNLAAPIKYEITAAEGVKISPAKGTGPKVKEESDIDPREFLLEVKGADGKSLEPIELTVRYFACNDDEGWCKAVTQKYTISLERDRDGGRAMSRSGNRGRGGRLGAGPGGRPGGGPPRGGPPGGFDPSRLFERFDADKDGKLTREELPPGLRARMERMDADEDGAVTLKEMEAMRKRFRGR